MSKRFKGKVCVYCGIRPATTADHIFARQFFLPHRRDNLPKVPACAECNGEKSRLEHNLTAVLPFGGSHGDSLAALSEMVPPRLAKNHTLRQRLTTQHSYVWDQSGNGPPIPAMTVPIDADVLLALLGYLAKGLAWHHWQVVIGPAYFVDPLMLNAPGLQRFNALWGLQAKARVGDMLGAGTFSYEGAQGVTDPGITVWRFTIFGGLRLAGDPRSPHEEVALFGALTGPRAVAAAAEAALAGDADAMEI